MSLEEIKTRFRAEIERRAADDQYIDRNEEREILQIALQLGMDRSVAYQALAQVCQAEGYILETAVLETILQQLSAAGGADGKLDRTEFELAFANAKRAIRGKKSDREIKTMIVQLMEDTGHNRVRTGWFTDWYASLKKELGLL